MQPNSMCRLSYPPADLPIHIHLVIWINAFCRSDPISGLYIKEMDRLWLEL
jgi:hypothetical protein